MLSRKSTLLVILIVLSLSVQNALAHISGSTSASADVRLETVGDDLYMVTEGDGTADVGPPGDFVHPAGYRHTADYYLHLTIAQVFPLETVYIVFFYKLIWDRSMTHSDDDTDKRRVYTTGDRKEETLAGPCLRGTAASDMRLKYLDDTGQIISQTSSSAPDSLFACPGGTSNAAVPSFTPEQHEAFRDELAELVASSFDAEVVGAFSINGHIFLQRRGVTYTYYVDGTEHRIGLSPMNRMLVSNA